MNDLGDVAILSKRGKAKKTESLDFGGGGERPKPGNVWNLKPGKGTKWKWFKTPKTKKLHHKMTEQQDMITQ